MRNTRDLAHQIGEYFSHREDIRGRLNPDGTLELEFDGRSKIFAPRYVLKPEIPKLRKLLEQSSKPDHQLILVAPRLTPRVLAFCRQNEFSAIDLNGAVYVRAKGLLIDRSATAETRLRLVIPSPNIFAGKSARILRTLLTDRDRAWQQSELVERAKVSPGLSSRVVRHLLNEGFAIKESPRVFRLLDHLALLDAWAASDRLANRALTLRYSGLGPTHLEQARQLHSLADTEGTRIAFTQWTGATLRHPYTEPVIVSAYVQRPLSKAALAAIGLREVEEGGGVWLHIPDEEGVFLETQQARGLTLASDAQLYLDLLRTGLRGPEQADAMREWEGFCRP